MKLSLLADGGSRWYEYFSVAFAEVLKPFNGSQVPDGFFLVSSLPGFVQIGAGFDVFPFETDFADVGTLSFDAGTYNGVGDGVGSVTALAADFVRFVAPDSTVLGAGVNYSTALSNVSGTVSLRDGKIVRINLSAVVTFTYADTPFGTLVYSGPFNIAGNRFTLRAGDPVTPGDIGYRWDLSGTVQGLGP